MPGEARPEDEHAAPVGASPRLHARILQMLRRRILDGSLPGAARLMESPLALELGVSRAPVRQALAALAAEGLIRRAQGRGFVVVSGGLVAEPPGLVRIDAAGHDRTGLDPALTVKPSWQPIYDAVEKAIVERISVAGWRIVEVDLARHFGVSRTIAREVMARLHQRGLVKRDDKSRWYAPALTADYISELYELRWTLEPLALLQASERAPPALIRRMHASLEDAIARAASLTGRELDALEAELHVELLRHCTNRTLLEALRLYQSLLVAHTFLYDASSSQFPSEPFLPEHMEVVEHLVSGDVTGAAQALAKHLRGACARAIARVDVIARGLEVRDLPYMYRLDKLALSISRD
ncbi:hypothetical protein ASE63_05675 [Bosea sp. Root381]|nr:hypothetical protein ASE63_05675 [Bosea sp. Root381]